MESTSEVEKHIPSFFQNSCPGNSAEEMRSEEEIAATPVVGECKRRTVVGGFTCCVPGCFSNSVRDTGLSFYSIPNGKSKEKQDLRRRWLFMISRQNFDNPGIGHRVCSKHFVGGRKTYMNNVPTIVPKNKGKKQQQPRVTIKARNRTANIHSTSTVMQSLDSSGSDTQLECDIEKNEISTADLSQQMQETEQKHLRRIAELELEIEHQKKINSDIIDEKRLLEMNNKRNFSVDNFKDNSKLFRFYTGLPDYETFRIIFESFGKAVYSLVYIGTNTNVGKLESADHIKRGPKRSLSVEQEFFLVLVRLRLGLLEEDIAYRAGVSSSHFSRIWITWLDFLHCKFRAYPIWPSKSAIQKTMPTCFRESYPTTRVIIDCTEIYIERPSSLRSQSATYSNYKHNNTVKGLLGIAPSGAVSFVSDLYTGRTSDKKAAYDCNLYSLLEAGDSIMADKGFAIEEDLPTGVTLNIPPFLRGKEVLSAKEELETRQIAAVRIHVERAISRIKTFRILSSVFPLCMAPDLNKVWVICSYLTNFLPSLLEESS